MPRLFLLACVLVSPCTAAEIIVTQLANQGVIVENGSGTRVMIDGMVVEPYSVYAGLPPEFHGAFVNASGPFAGIDLALASHRHHEHNQPIFACRFMQNSPATVFASSTQVMDLMREKCREFTLTSPRMRIIEPQYEQPEVLRIKDAAVTVFPLSHGVGKYAALRNFAHLVEMSGIRILHVGDAAMEAEDFARVGVDRMNIDIALIPFWYFQPGPGGSIVRRYLDATHKVAVHVPPAELEDVRNLLRLEYPDVSLLENVFDQARFGGTSPASP